MTSTNDGKDVKSNQTSGHKSKSYYIELYTSLEKALSGDNSLEERTSHVCEAWRRVYSLYLHSATSTHPHLLRWLQRHTANTVLQSKWAKSKDEHTRLTEAIDSLVAEATAASAGRPQHPWEQNLLQRAAWFRNAIENPWDNPVLKSLINPDSEPVTDQQVLEWLISEHGVVLVARLQRMVGAGNCDDLALLLASAVMDRARSALPHHPDERADEKAEEPDESSFVTVLEREASFTSDEWEMLTDIELVLLFKTDKRPRCIELAKLTPLRNGYKMVERLRKRLETSPREKKLWKHAKEVATIVTQVLIARCMVLRTCSGVGREALVWCARALPRLVGAPALRAVCTALAAPAATARHLHTFCLALSAECKELKTDVIMKPFICELYVRAITAGMNELEQLKLNAEKESEARLYEQTLAGWFMQLGGRLTDSVRLRAECALTAFSVHPAHKHYERVAATHPPQPSQTLEPKSETTSEYGSWANDSRTQSNLVKTSETLQLKQSQQHQANVLSTAILTEGEALGLEPELCQDLAVLLSGPRVKTLSWDMDRDVLLDNCRAYMEKTHGGTRAVTTELKYLNLDPNAYQHLPEEDDDENDIYYGIEKGYEHEVQLEEPEEIWQNAFFDPEQTESANDSEVDQIGTKKSKGFINSEEDEDPLSIIADAKKEKKKRAKDKEQRKKKTHKQDDGTLTQHTQTKERKDKGKDKKPKKERNKSEQPTAGSLTSLLGMKIAKVPSPVQDGEKRVRKKKERRRESTLSNVSLTNSDYDSHVKSHDDVLLDGFFSIDELKSPERVKVTPKPIDNTKTTVKSEMRNPVINDLKSRKTSSPTVTTSSDSDVASAKYPYLTPNQLAYRHIVTPSVKSSLHKLLQFRRNQNKIRTSTVRPPPAHTLSSVARPTLAHTQTPVVRHTAVVRPPPAHTPTPVIRPPPAHTQTSVARPPPAHTPTNTLVGMKVYNPEEIPKVYLNKKQSKQLEALSNDINIRLKDVMYKSPYNEVEDNKLQSQVYNAQKYNPHYNTHVVQNVLNECPKLSDYTTHSPVKQTVLNQPHASVIQSNYASPTKLDAMQYAVNLSPQKPTITYQPFHKSMQNLSTDKQDSPKKPLLINDPNYFSGPHVKAKASQLSPRILSNTVIKPPSQSSTTKDDISQTYSNLHRTYPSKPAQNNSHITNMKSDVIQYGQRQLSSSMQNITEVPTSSYDTTRRLITTPSDILHGPASQAKTYKVISHSDALNSAQALLSSNCTQTSRSNTYQNRERNDVKAPPTENNNFDEFLCEIVKSIRAGSSVPDKNVEVALNKDVRMSYVKTPSTSKRTDLVTPQSAKQLQQKKSENAPNTFSRLSYMHKNKQNENRIQVTDAVTMELNKNILDHKISKAKCMKNELTISRVGMTNSKAPGKSQRNCPLLSSMLESPSPTIPTFPVSTCHNSSENQPNREDADLLLLLRNQTILQPNPNATQASTSDGRSQSTLHLNSHIKVETPATHQTLVGTKVKNILDTCTIKKEAEDDEWKRVMDAIRAQKTEPLGPNALDLALKKNQRRRPQTCARTSGMRVAPALSSSQNKYGAKKRDNHSSKASSTRKPSTEKHSVIPNTSKDTAVMKKVSPVMLNRIDMQNKLSSSSTPKEGTHVSTIPNSDYDMLDDLIDDDLRREIGELSSEEEAYTGQNIPLSKGKSSKNIPKTNLNVCKTAVMSKGKPHVVSPETITAKKETYLNMTYNNDRSGAKTCSMSNYANPIRNNSSHPAATRIENREIAVKPETAPQYAPSTSIITNQVAQNTADNIVTHMEANQYVNNIVPTNMIIASVPQSAPVVVIRQDLIYDPYTAIRIHENQVNAELCTINQNVFAVNATPNIALYQTTQFAAPVINPIIIGNATTTTNVSNPTGTQHVAPDFVKEDLNTSDDRISLETALRLSDAISETPEPPNLDFNMNRNCERKVLSQVHENHTVAVDKKPHICRSTNDDVPLKTEQDKERLKLKRQSLINRKISHAGDHPPIALTYEPLTEKDILSKRFIQESAQNGSIESNLKLIPDDTSNEIVAVPASVQSPTSEINNENIETTNPVSNINQKKCRRIWLRSSKTLPNKQVSPVKLSRVALKRKAIKHPASDKTENTMLTNSENVNKESIKITKRTSKRILIKNKPDTNKPIPIKRQQNVQNDELIDFERDLDSSIVLKSTAAMFDNDKSMQKPETGHPAEEPPKDKLGLTFIEKLKHQLGDQVIIRSASEKTAVKEEPVIAKNQNLLLGDQRIIRSTSEKTAVKEEPVIAKNQNLILGGEVMIRNALEETTVKEEPVLAKIQNLPLGDQRIIRSTSEKTAVKEEPVIAKNQNLILGGEVMIRNALEETTVKEEPVLAKIQNLPLGDQRIIRSTSEKTAVKEEPVIAKNQNLILGGEVMIRNALEETTVKEEPVLAKIQNLPLGDQRIIRSTLKKTVLKEEPVISKNLNLTLGDQLTIRGTSKETAVQEEPTIAKNQNLTLGDQLTIRGTSKETAVKEEPTIAKNQNLTLGDQLTIRSTSKKTAVKEEPVIAKNQNLKTGLTTKSTSKKTAVKEEPVIAKNQNLTTGLTTKSTSKKTAVKGEPVIAKNHNLTLGDQLTTRSTSKKTAVKEELVIAKNQNLTIGDQLTTRSTLKKNAAMEEPVRPKNQNLILGDQLTTRSTSKKTAVKEEPVIAKNLNLTLGDQLIIRSIAEKTTVNEEHVVAKNQNMTTLSNKSKDLATGSQNNTNSNQMTVKALKTAAPTVSKVPLVVDETYEVKPSVVVDRKVITQTTSVRSPNLVDECNKPKLTSVDSSSLPLDETNKLNSAEGYSSPDQLDDSSKLKLTLVDSSGFIDKRNILKSTVHDDQNLIKQASEIMSQLNEQKFVRKPKTPEVSTTLTRTEKPQNNNSTVTESTRKVDQNLSVDFAIPTNTGTKKNYETDPKQSVHTPPQERPNMLKDDDIEIIETSEVEAFTETKELNSNADILSCNQLGKTANKDQLVMKESLLCKGNINEILNDKSIVNEDVQSERIQIPKSKSKSKCQNGQMSKLQQSNIKYKPKLRRQCNNPDGSLQTVAQSESENNTTRKILSEPKNSANPENNMKGDIKIEEIPFDDPNKTLVRIILPSGKILKATIFAKLKGNYDSIFAEPSMRAILANNSFSDGTRFTVNYKHVQKTYKDDPTKSHTIIEHLDINEKLKTVDTVNLVSDDEDEVLNRSFNTEFGKYTTNLDQEAIALHQKKFDLRCEVKVLREDLFKSNITKPKSRSLPLKNNSLLTRNKSKLQSASTITSNINKDGTDSKTNMSTDIQTTPPSLIETDTSKQTKTADVIEIDDSSNDSIENQIPDTRNNKDAAPVEIATITNLLLQDLVVATPKDNVPLPPVKTGKAVVNLTSALLQDLGLVPAETPVIDITENDDDDIPKDITQPIKNGEKNTPVLYIQHGEDNKIDKIQGQLSLKKCGVILEKCDKLITKYELMKKMKDCYVKMERLNNIITPTEKEKIGDGEPNNTNQENADDLIEFDVDEPFSSPRISRCPSLSILNNWDHDNQPALESRYCASPVIEVYETIVQLRHKLETQPAKESMEQLSPTCDSDWTMTKSKYKARDIQLRYQTESKLVLPLCDTIDIAENISMAFEAPKLLKIALKILEEDPSLLRRWELLRRKERTLKIRPFANKLKRKTDEVIGGIVASKVLKLGTIALNALNSGIKTFLKPKNLEASAIQLDNVNNSNVLIVEAVCKYKTTSVENIKIGNQTQETVNTNVSVSSKVNSEETRSEETVIIAESDLNCREEPQDPGHPIESTKMDYLPTHDQPEMNLQESPNMSVEHHVSQLKDEQTCVRDLPSDIETSDKESLVDDRELVSPSLLIDYIETYDQENRNSKNVIPAEVVKNNQSTGEGITFYHTDLSEDNQKLSTPLSPALTNSVTDDKAKRVITEANFEQAVEVKPSELKAIRKSTFLPDSNDDSTFSLPFSDNKHISITTSNAEVAMGDLSPVITANEQKISLRLSVSYNSETSGENKEMDIKNQKAREDSSQLKELGNWSSMKVGNLIKNITSDQQQEDTFEPLIDENTKNDNELKQMHIDTSAKDIMNKLSHLGEEESSNSCPINIESLGEEFTDDIPDEMSPPPLSDSTENYDEENQAIIISTQSDEVSESPGEDEVCDTNSLNNDLSQEVKSMQGCSTYNTDSFDEDSTGGPLELNSPLTTAKLIETEEKEKCVSTSIKDPTDDSLHIEDSDQFIEISMNNEICEVVVTTTEDHDELDIVEALVATGHEMEPTTKEDPEIKSPDFIDSNKITFNYHDYTKLCKNQHDLKAHSVSSNDCAVNNVADVTEECAPVTTSENYPVKLKPECQYELIQKDDLLTVKIIAENREKDKETKTVFVGPDEAGEGTVAASPCSNTTDDVNLKGFEYDDVYVFPLSRAVSYDSTMSIDSLASTSESMTNNILDELHDIDFHVKVPNRTYSRKRKMSMRDVKVTEKKYRKGKNIDCSKQTQISMIELAYSKEYKRLLEYCSSVRFSYTRPFHKECIELEELTGNWPLQSVCCDIPGDISDEQLFVNLEDFDSYQPDPVTQTLVDEISFDYNKTVVAKDDPQSEASETNFNMGFGEGSGRVIQILKKGGESNISAATLSDVKQSQPVFKSVDSDHDHVATKDDDEIKKIRQHVNFMKLRDKVRQFFKKTTDELKYDWMQHNTKDVLHPEDFPFGLCSLDYVKPFPTNAIVQVVQVGQLPVSVAAQNPVTCDPRVTQVSDASPSQCSVDNSPNDDSQSEIKTEYTELTTADLTLPLQEYAQQNPTSLASQDSNVILTEQTISLEMEIKAEESPEIKQELPDIKEEKSNSSDTDLHTLTNAMPENIDYSYENNTAKTNASSVNYDSEQKSSETFSQLRQQNGTTEKTDQIAHAMNAAGITTTPETVTNTRAHALVNILSQKIRQGSVNTTQTTTNTYSKASINAMALQQALAQILPPPLNQTGSSENSQNQSTSVGPQVLHIVQGKNASGNQITLVDNSQQSVISTPNATQVLHIVQNKNATSGQASNGTLTPQANSFSGLSLVEAGLQQGGNQLLHIVNTGNQKTANPGQLLKRVNLLTNLTNVQGSNEQKMVQFVCKSADGKAIQLNAPHQRSMVLRLQPIETPNIQTPSTKPSEPQEHSPSPNGSAASKESASQQEIKSRSIYEENYAKFIQSSSSKTPGLEKSTSLPKFNQAFGKPVFQDGSQKQGEAPANNSHLPSVNTNSENAECPANDNAINLEHMGNISSPPLLIRKPVVTTTQSQSNIVQQIKQTIAPMNIQTMHGGVIYTRQIPVNIGGGQTINLITVPSTELINDDSSKTQSQNNQGEIEPSIIKIVPQSQTTNNTESSQEESNNHASGSNDNAQTPQPQPVLTQMRIKLPMLSKAPQMVPGARVVRPSFFQIQRNVIGGANQPVYQQLVLTAAPPLGQQTIRLPSQASRPVKVPSESQSSSSESQMSTSTLEQLREFDMVLEQVKERSTSTPSATSNSSSFKIHTSSSDTTDGNASSNCSTESTPQVLYSIGNNQSLNVAYVNRKTTVTTPTTSTYVRSPDSSGIADSPTSSTHVQISHTVTTDSSPTEMSSQSKSAKVGSKSKSRPKSTSNPPNTLKLSSSVPPKTSSQKPLEDEQTTQRILYILAEYKEQVENSPDKDKPAPRRRSNPPSNPGSSKRKKSSSSRRSGTRDMSPVHGEDTCRTMGSEDSSCGTSQGDCTESCLDSHSPQDSPRKVARKITFDQDLTVTQPRPQPQRNVIVADGQTITVARGTTGKPATAVLMPANYILPVSMVKGGQQIAIVTNRGPKLLTVGGEGGATNALLLQRLIGPAGLKPVLARPGVRHVRLPTAALHNLQAFNLATATTVQPPDSTASPRPGPTPPELVDTRANSSPWTDRDEVKPERSSSPEGSEPWNLPSTDAHEYTYEETVRTDNMDRTVLVVQKKDGSQRQHRLAHVSAAALRHKYAILEHELRLQKSLSEECEDLGVDSPSASELFPEAELLFANSPAHEHNQEHQSHTPQPLQSSIPQPDMDDQIATDHLIPREIDVGLGLGDVGIVAVSEDGSATIALDQEEFARSHPNTTFHSEPTDGEVNNVQPFTITGLKGRHITSTIFHSNSAPATVLMTAPQATVISQAPEHSVKYEIENMIHSMPSSHSNDMNLSSVLVKDDGLTRYDNILTDSRELHLTNTASAIVHSSGNATQVIRRVCYEDDKRERDARYLIDEPDNLIAGDDAKMVAEDSSRDATLESMADVDDDRSSPERHAELFWESNSASERSESRRPLDFSSDSDKCCKSPSFDETNSTDSSGVGTHMRLDSVIKEARTRERSGSADGSSADDTHPPLRTYPPKRLYHPLEEERSLSGKTRAGQRSPDSLEVRRRASGRGVVKRGCHCCNGEPAPPRPKKPRQRKPTLDFTNN